MRPKDGLDIGAAITELAVGEALVSFLDEKGRPSLTERVFVLPPSSQIGPIAPAQRQALLADSLVAGVYEKVVDRDSAFEAIKGRTQARQPAGTTQSQVPAPNAPTASQPDAPPAAPDKGILDSIGDMFGGGTRRTRTSVGEQLARSAASSIGREVGRQIIRGVLGGIFGGSRR
jgi:hypothetical protein